MVILTVIIAIVLFLICPPVLLFLVLSYRQWRSNERHRQWIEYIEHGKVGDIVRKEMEGWNKQST